MYGIKLPHTSNRSAAQILVPLLWLGEVASCKVSGSVNMNCTTSNSIITVGARQMTAVQLKKHLESLWGQLASFACFIIIIIFFNVTYTVVSVEWYRHPICMVPMRVFFSHGVQRHKSVRRNPSRLQTQVALVIYNASVFLQPCLD